MQSIFIKLFYLITAINLSFVATKCKIKLFFNQYNGSMANASKSNKRKLNRHKAKNPFRNERKGFFWFNVVVPLGFEPRAAGLENLCSIQLSYRTN